jgi:hypothetical protein
MRAVIHAASGPVIHAASGKAVQEPIVGQSATTAERPVVVWAPIRAAGDLRDTP